MFALAEPGSILPEGPQPVDRYKLFILQVAALKYLIGLPNLC